MKINGDHIPDRMTHEEAADLFMSTAVGRSTGVSREQFLAMLRARFPTEVELSAFIQTAKALLDVSLGGLQPPMPARRYFEFTIGPDNASITCNTCGMTSYHPQDVQNRYCGKCHKFHER